MSPDRIETPVFRVKVEPVYPAETEGLLLADSTITVRSWDAAGAMKAVGELIENAVIGGGGLREPVSVSVFVERVERDGS